MERQELIRQAAKIAKAAGRRSARLYYGAVKEKVAFHKPSTQAFTGTPSSVQNHPLVLVSVASGILGVAMLILIVFSVWLRRRCYEDMRQKSLMNTTTYSTASCQTVTSLAPSTVLDMEGGHCIELSPIECTSVPIEAGLNEPSTSTCEMKSTAAPSHPLDII